MLETIVTVLVVATAVVWFVRWLRGAGGGGGCSCGGCGRKNCAGRTFPEQ